MNNNFGVGFNSDYNAMMGFGTGIGTGTNDLVGTNLDDIDHTSVPVPVQVPVQVQTEPSANKDLIKSLTKEIINNLKDSNVSLYENMSGNSRYSKSSSRYENFDNESTQSNGSEKKKGLKKKKHENKDETDDERTEQTEKPTTNKDTNYFKWFFDECFDYKDFLILFTLYFVLSQDMVKDFFSKYFKSLSPDDEGKVGIQGVLIYGLILCVLFMIIKKMF